MTKSGFKKVRGKNGYSKISLIKFLIDFPNYLKINKLK